MSSRTSPKYTGITTKTYIAREVPADGLIYMHLAPITISALNEHCKRRGKFPGEVIDAAINSFLGEQLGFDIGLLKPRSRANQEDHTGVNANGKTVVYLSSSKKAAGR